MHALSKASFSCLNVCTTAHAKAPKNLACIHLIDQHASHCMGKMSESDFGFDRVRKFGI